MDAGLDFLLATKAFAGGLYDEAPKGTPFYFLGMEAFVAHDYQTATCLFDAALAEDRSYLATADQAPAARFMNLDVEHVDHRALPIVKSIVATLQRAIDDYNSRPDSTLLTVADIRQGFLAHTLDEQRTHLRPLTTAFVAFIAEGPFRARLMGATGGASVAPFLMYIFRGCLLLESLVRETNKLLNPKSLEVFLNKLKGDLKLNRTIKASAKFEDVLAELPSRKCMTEVIESAARARNTLGHNLIWERAKLDEQSYNLLVGNVTASCLHVISCLYR